MEYFSKSSSPIDSPPETPRYSFVIPVFNEHETLFELKNRMVALLKELDGPAEVVLIDDGSNDDSLKIITQLHRDDPRFKVIALSRNFGHQIAVTAGLDHASGQAIIVLDADLQDPPEIVFEMIKRWKEGYEIVYAIRQERRGESWFKKISAAIFYRLLIRLTDIRIPTDVGDFRLVDRQALEAFNQLREHGRYIRGMFSWVGFRQIGVSYTRAERFAGQTKYPFRKMIKLAIDGILSFSNAPLRMTLNLGFLISGMSFLIGLVSIVLKIFDVYTISGWASLIVVFTFLGGTQLVVIGIIGEYVGRIYDEVRQRPLYLIREKRGITALRHHQYYADKTNV